MKLGNLRRIAAAGMLAVAGLLALGSFGSTAMAAEGDAAPQPTQAVSNAVAPVLGASPISDVSDVSQVSDVTGIAQLSERADHGVTCPAQVPSHPTGADYVNAWNASGACFGAGAAGLVSSAWAGAIPSITQGALAGY